MAGKEGDEEDKVGANRYLRVKFSMDPTTYEARLRFQIWMWVWDLTILKK